MSNYGTVAIFLMFSMSFALYAGSGGEYGSSFMLLMGELGEETSGGLFNSVLNSFLSPEIAAGAAITAIAAAVSGYTVTYTLPALALGALANYFLFPLDSLKEAGGGMPVMLEVFLFGFFNLLLVVAIVSFVRGSSV